MKSLIYIWCSILPMLIIGHSHASDSVTSILSTGKTVIETSTKELTARVTIHTFEVPLARDNSKLPGHQSRCTRSRYPCTVVEQIEITANGNKLFIPRSSFCDLTDLSRGTLTLSGPEGELTLYGGDASESYVVKIYFDTDNVNRRTLASDMASGELLQDTRYYSVVLE